MNFPRFIPGRVYWAIPTNPNAPQKLFVCVSRDAFKVGFAEIVRLDDARHYAFDNSEVSQIDADDLTYTVDSGRAVDISNYATIREATERRAL